MARSLLTKYLKRHALRPLQECVKSGRVYTCSLCCPAAGSAVFRGPCGTPGPPKAHGRGLRTCGSLPARSRAPGLSALLPARLANAGNLALVGQLTEADAADAVLAEVGVRPSANLAAVILPARKLLRSALLNLHGCFGQSVFLLYLAKGAPIRVSSSRASSSVLAVVTKAMSMPRIWSTLSYSISGKMSCSRRPKA